jgi:hypothetical protein
MVLFFISAPQLPLYTCIRTFQSEYNILPVCIHDECNNYRYTFAGTSCIDGASLLLEDPVELVVLTHLHGNMKVLIRLRLRLRKLIVIIVFGTMIKHILNVIIT